ncbi:MAG: di-trans,poly-cis-decaprenylcistransferase [Clostridia bacterium]|nr:di-trans,poly-cis-decaprenylcistransferase [Clostridia bacterium]
MALFVRNRRPVVLDGRLRHIAFIMDGNGRWAQKRGLPREQGHKIGAKAFQKIALHCESLGFEAMTVYAFSTENWKRPAREVDAIMDLLEEYIDSSEKEMEGHSVRFCFIGDRSPLRPSLQEKMTRVEEITADGRMTLNIAINYGARAELCRAAEQLRSTDTPITEQAMSEALYTAKSGDPDIIVRTGGDLRISNFLLWQAAYAELYFSKKLWPDFSPEDVDDVIREFYTRKRRYGGL